jgi:hypothetical protein
MPKALSRCCSSICCAILIVLFVVPVWLWGEAPAWWATRGVINTSATAADDYAVVNQGQVKNIASKAYAEMKDKVPGGAGGTLDGIWLSPAPSTDDYRAVNIGQLKNVAKPFYDRLIVRGLAVSYPWATSSAGADDYALVNIGQVKNLFSFAIPVVVDPNDADADGMLDSWEVTNFGDLRYTSSGDADGDGLSNLAEFLAGTNPNSAATSVSVATASLVIFSP